MEFKFKAVIGIDGRKHFSSDNNICFCGQQIAREEFRNSRSIVTCTVCDSFKSEFEELNKSFKDLTNDS